MRGFYGTSKLAQELIRLDDKFRREHKKQTRSAIMARHSAKERMPIAGPDALGEAHYRALYLLARVMFYRVRSKVSVWRMSIGPSSRNPPTIKDWTVSDLVTVGYVRTEINRSGEIEAYLTDSGLRALVGPGMIGRDVDKMTALTPEWAKFFRSRTHTPERK